MNPDTVAQILKGLEALPFFPTSEAALRAVTRLVCSMAETEQQVEWLVARMTSGIYQEWPGPAEVRGCFCHRFKPKDGINGYSSVYPDGLPPDPTVPKRLEITGQEPKRLERGEPMTADPELQARLEKAAEKFKMPDARLLDTQFARMLKDVETPPNLRQGPEQPINLDFKPITQDDIDREVEKLREKKVKEPA